MSKNAVRIGLILGAFVVPAWASATTLDFSTGITCFNGSPGQPCGDGYTIDQTYGDEAGLDIIYDRHDAINPGAGLAFWDNGYGGTSNVGYGAVGTAAEIFLKPSAGFQVTLNSFVLAAYLADRVAIVEVFEDGNPVALSSGNLVIPYGAGSGPPTLFNINQTSSAGFHIFFGPDAYNTGFDNLDFTVSAVPLPAAAWLLISGLAAVGGVARRRRAAAAAA